VGSGAPVRPGGPLRVNVGCGSTPTPGWVNLDNSPTVVLGRAPWLPGLLLRAGALSDLQRTFLAVVRDADIRWADAARRIPFPDGSVDVVYSSHMIEHLDRAGARRLLAEIRRVLRPGGVARIAAPDLRRLAEAYLAGGGADAFVDGTLLARDRPTSLGARLKLLLTGGRDHAWMYDADSLAAFVRAAGFDDVRALPPGETRVPDPGALDLHERAGESVYVEATRP